MCTFTHGDIKKKSRKYPTQAATSPHSIHQALFPAGLLCADRRAEDATMRGSAGGWSHKNIKRQRPTQPTRARNNIKTEATTPVRRYTRASSNTTAEPYKYAILQVCEPSSHPSNMRWTARSPVPPWCEKQSGRTAGPSPLLIVAQTHVTEAGSCRTPSETRKERTKVNYLCPACAAPRLSGSGVCVDGGSSPSSRRRDVFAYRPPPQRTFTHQRRPTFFVLVYRPTSPHYTAL